MRIRTKLAIAIVLVAVILSAVVFVSIEAFKVRTANQAQEDVDQTASQAAAQIDAVVRERINTVRFYASRPEVARGDEATLDQFVSGTRFYAVQVVDANGTVTAYRGQIADETRQDVIGQDVSDEPYVRSIIEDSDSVYVSDIRRDDTNDANVLIISAPIFDPETGDLTGVYAGAVRISVGDFFAPTRPLQTDRQTVSVQGTANGDSLLLLEPEQQFDQAITGRGTVETTNWVVSVSTDRSQVNAELRTLAVAQGIGIVFVILVVAGLGYWEYRVNISQTEELLDGFVQLQEGQYDHNLSLSAAEEWQQISDGYNDLATGLAEREQAIREREERLGVINRLLRHNLRNDMSVILTYADMLPGFEDRSRREQAAEKIRDMGEGLIAHGEKARQIEDAMESAEAGLTTVELTPLVRETVSEVQNEYPEVTFTTDLPDAAPAEAIDSFEFAVSNLIENAAEHNDADDPAVDINLQWSDDTVRLRIADNGPGIPEHEREVLFQGQETALEHGSGIGLWVAHWVVESSEGQLIFDDNEPRGSVVTIELGAAPLSEASGPDDGQQPTSAVTAILEGEGATGSIEPASSDVDTE